MAVKTLANIILPATTTAALPLSALVLVAPDGSLFNTGVTTGTSITSFPPPQFIYNGSYYDSVTMSIGQTTLTGIVATLDLYRILPPGTVVGAGTPICMETGASGGRVTFAAPAGGSRTDLIPGGTINGTVKDVQPLDFFVLAFFVSTSPSPGGIININLQAQCRGKNAGETSF